VIVLSWRLALFKGRFGGRTPDVIKFTAELGDLLLRECNMEVLYVFEVNFVNADAVFSHPTAPRRATRELFGYNGPILCGLRERRL
jgi:hypothetical protein